MHRFHSLTKQLCSPFMYRFLPTWTYIFNTSAYLNSGVIQSSACPMVWNSTSCFHEFCKILKRDYREAQRQTRQPWPVEWLRGNFSSCFLTLKELEIHSYVHLTSTYIAVSCGPGIELKFSRQDGEDLLPLAEELIVQRKGRVYKYVFFILYGNSKNDLLKHKLIYCLA